MSIKFQLRPSNKSSLNSIESYIVTRGDVSYLRLLGAEPSWELMTATASEDDGSINVCTDQLSSIESAVKLAIELNVTPQLEKDWAGRDYVKICGVTRHNIESDAQFSNALIEILQRYFEIFDATTSSR